MKKGCFITAVVIFTLMVGVVVYYVKYKKDSLTKIAKEKFIETVAREFDDKIQDIKQSVFKDSMKTAMHNFFTRSQKDKIDSVMNDIHYVMTRASLLIRDKVIDSSDYFEIKEVLTRYERSKKNRN